MSKNIILNKNEIGIILNRLACQLIENHQDFSKTILIGLQPNGKTLLNRLVQILTNKYNISELNYGLLDITFYRDDFRRNEKILEANKTDNLHVEGKNVVFLDDVLFTGRTIRAALTAVETFGRPNNIELLTFIDRRFSRHLPIQPDYRGRQIDVYKNQKVIVDWNNEIGEDCVYIINKL
jgi:pyrimidine operon attenuation protein / uracil phosphoribosyltransferase